MPVFITGGTGYIGASVVRELRKRTHVVRALARNDAAAEKLRALGAEPVRGELRDLDVLRIEAANADAVIHCAFEYSAEAVALVQQSRPDLVILDLRLADGGLGTEVAAQLAPLGRPGILYVTGNMSQVALTNGDACLAKPYRSVDLLRGLEIVAEIVATGKAQPPFPRGFQLLHPAADAQEVLL